MITKQVEILNRNGDTLRGVITLPGEGGTYKTVVNLHGFGGTRGGYKSIHVSMARELAASGTACVRFDFFGNGESDGNFEDMTFTGLLHDAADICSWVRKQDWFQPSGLILSGQSMGGFAAASAAPLIHPDALILMCPGTGMFQGCRERSEAMEAQGIQFGDVDGLKFSHSFNYDLASHPPFEDALGYSGPVLILKGTKDELVDDSVCNRYLELYGTSGQYVRIDGADHNFASIKAREKLHAEICRFIQSL